MNRKEFKLFGEAEYNISADYRSHYEVMRDSSVAKKKPGRDFKRDRAGD